MHRIPKTNFLINMTFFKGFKPYIIFVGINNRINIKWQCHKIICKNSVHKCQIITQVKINNNGTDNNPLLININS